MGVELQKEQIKMMIADIKMNSRLKNKTLQGGKKGILTKN